MRNFILDGTANPPRATLLAAALALVLGAPAEAIASPDSQCWADWSAAAPIVHKEKLMPAKDLRGLMEARKTGQLLTITLCQEKGKYLYKLVILGAAGRVENLTVDARKPF